MEPEPRHPRLVGVYVVLVLLLVISGLLAVGGQPIYALLVLGIATLLNVRMLMLRNRLHGRPESSAAGRPPAPAREPARPPSPLQEQS